MRPVGSVGAVGPVGSDSGVRLISPGRKRRVMYRARDRVENEGWLGELEEVADRLGLSGEARSRAADLFLSNVPESERSKRAVLATSLYVASLAAGDGRSQAEIAEAAGVTRLTIQGRWKPMLEDAGLDAPEW